MTPLVFPLFRDSNLIASALVVIAEIRKIKTLTSKCTKDQKNLEKKNSEKRCGKNSSLFRAESHFRS